MEQVIVRIDDRVRLISAVLAATSWPDDEQARHPHGTHAHARGTRRLLSAHTKHPAALVLQALLERNAPLEAIYTYVMQLSWPGLTGAAPPPWAPPTWPRHLLSFYRDTGLEQWWQDEAAVWDRSRQEAARVFNGAAIKQFLQPFVGDFHEALVFVPNVCYPSDIEIGVRVDAELCCITPPRLAWGDNPPWPFDEDPTHVYRAVLTQFGRLMMRAYLYRHQEVVNDIARQPLLLPDSFVKAHPDWEDQFLTLFVTGLVALYLEDAVSQQEAAAYVLMQQKVYGLGFLPGVVSVLRRFLAGRDEGKYPGFIDYLPHFGKHLRVAKTITTL